MAFFCAPGLHCERCNNTLKNAKSAPGECKTVKIQKMTVKDKQRTKWAIKIIIWRLKKGDHTDWHKIRAFFFHSALCVPIKGQEWHWSVDNITNFTRKHRA